MQILLNHYSYFHENDNQRRVRMNDAGFWKKEFEIKVQFEEEIANVGYIIVKGQTRRLQTIYGV